MTNLPAIEVTNNAMQEAGKACRAAQAAIDEAYDNATIEEMRKDGFADDLHLALALARQTYDAARAEWAEHI